MCDMELQLRLALPTNNNNNDFKHKKEFHVKSKRSFGEAFETIRDELQTMPLLLWSGQPPNDEEDEKRSRKKRNSSSSINKEEEEGKHVGWPPIQSWRKNMLYQDHDNRRVGRNTMENSNQNNRMAAPEIEKEDDGDGSRSNSMYIKVKMEGVGIARKIDVMLYESFHTLTQSLIVMFEKYDKRGGRYTLTYQDNEGDWLLAGDVPWQTFIESVQRLEILRS